VKPLAEFIFFSNKSAEGLIVLVMIKTKEAILSGGAFCKAAAMRDNRISPIVAAAPFIP
jgi:hypothetical protein